MRVGIAASFGGIGYVQNPDFDVFFCNACSSRGCFCRICFRVSFGICLFGLIAFIGRIIIRNLALTATACEQSDKCQDHADLFPLAFYHMKFSFLTK